MGNAGKGSLHAPADLTDPRSGTNDPASSQDHQGTKSADDPDRKTDCGAESYSGCHSGDGSSNGEALAHPVGRVGIGPQRDDMLVGGDRFHSMRNFDGA